MILIYSKIIPSLPYTLTRGSHVRVPLYATPTRGSDQHLPEKRRPEAGTVGLARHDPHFAPQSDFCTELEGSTQYDHIIPFSNLSAGLLGALRGRVSEPELSLAADILRTPIKLAHSAQSHVTNVRNSLQSLGAVGRAAVGAMHLQKDQRA